MAPRFVLLVLNIRYHNGAICEPPIELHIERASYSSYIGFRPVIIQSVLYYRLSSRTNTIGPIAATVPRGPVKIGVHYLWSNNITHWVQSFLSIMLPFLCALLLTVIGILCIVLLSWVYFCHSCVLFLLCVCIAVLHTLVAGLLARSQYSEGPATGHLDTDFSWFPCVYKQMLRWVPKFQVATTCFSCSHPDLNFLDPYFMFMYMRNNHCHRVTAHFQFIIIIIIIIKKVKWSCYRPGVAQRVGRGIALLFHDRGTRGACVVRITPRPHFIPGKDPVLIVQEAGWIPGPVWMGGESRPHWDSIPDSPASSRSLYRLSYSADIIIIIIIIIIIL